MRVFEERDTKVFYSETAIYNWFDKYYDSGDFQDDQDYLLERDYTPRELLFMDEEEQEHARQEIYNGVKEIVFDNLEEYFIIHEVIEGDE